MPIGRCVEAHLPRIINLTMMRENHLLTTLRT